MAGLVQVHVLEGVGSVSVHIMVSWGSVDGDMVDGGGSNVVDGSGVMSLLVMGVLVMGMSFAGHLSLESVSVILVVHDTPGAISLHQRVVARDRVSITLLLLLLDVSGVRILDSVRELVVGGGVMMGVVMILMMMAVQGQEGSSSQLVVRVSVVRDHLVVCVAVLALVSVTDVSGEDAGAGHGQDAQDSHESEGHCKLR